LFDEGLDGKSVLAGGRVLAREVALNSFLKVGEFFFVEMWLEGFFEGGDTREKVLLGEGVLDQSFQFFLVELWELFRGEESLEKGNAGCPWAVGVDFEGALSAIGG
jgi:hypothetical protein